MPDWLHHVLAAGRILFKNTLEAYMDQYMQSKVEQILQEHRLVSLITQLRGGRGRGRRRFFSEPRTRFNVVMCFLQTPCSARAARSEPKKTDRPGPSRRSRR